MTYPAEQLTEANRLEGYAIWAVLNSHVRLSRGGINNQLGSPSYEPNEPQTIEIEFEYDRHPDMPPDFFAYDVSCMLDKDQNLENAVVTFRVFTPIKEIDLLEVHSYELRLSQFLALIPFLKSNRFREVVDLLPPCFEYEDYELSRLGGGQ